MGGSCRPRVALVAQGCRVNHADVDALAAELAGAFELARAGEVADVVVVSGCAVTADADSAARQAIRRAARENPGAAIVAAGCCAGIRPEALSALPGVAAVVGPRAAEGVAAVVARLAAEAAALRAPPRSPPPCIRAGGERGSEAASVPGARARPLLKVQDGCDRRCAYCVVPLARGASRSLPLAEALRRLARLGERHAEVVLTGVHLGGYGRDLAPRSSLAALVGDAARRRLVRRLRVSSLDPAELPGELLRDPDARAVLCEHFHLPVQSGSPRVLAAMGRRGGARDLRRAVEAVTAAAPGACLGTDLLVGFPGETDADHAATLALVEALPLAYLHVFPFSPRPGTAAATLGGAVPAPRVRERVRALRALSDRRWRAYVAAQVGSEREVVVERAAGGLAWGTADRYVSVRWPAAAARRGDLVRVRVVATDGETCLGAAGGG